MLLMTPEQRAEKVLLTIRHRIPLTPSEALFLRDEIVKAILVAEVEF